jgi:hypothetical protein
MPDPVPSPASGAPPVQAGAPVVLEATGEAPEAPLSDASPAAKSRAYTKAAIATQKANEARANAERQAAEARRDLEAAKAEKTKLEEDLAAFEKDPLGWTAKHGKPYDELTKLAIGDHEKNTVEARLQRLQDEREAEKLAAAKEKTDAAARAQQEATQAKVMGYLKSVTDFATANKATYDLLAEMAPDAANTLIYEFCDEFAKRTGKLLTPKDACDLLQAELESEGVKLASAPSVKRKLAPPPPVAKVPVTNVKIKEMLEKREAKLAKSRPASLNNRNANAPLRREDEAKEKKMTRKEALAHARETVWGNKGV